MFKLTMTHHKIEHLNEQCGTSKVCIALPKCLQLELLLVIQLEGNM